MVIDVHAEVLTRVAAESKDHTLVAVVLERHVVIRVALTLTDRGIARPEQSTPYEGAPVIVVDLERIVRDPIRLHLPRPARVQDVGAGGIDFPRVGRAHV